MTKNIIITGTSRGIGYELALQFANSGHQVLAISRKTPQELIENKNSPYSATTLDQLKLIATGFKDIQKTDPNLEPIGALYLLAIMNGTVQPDDTVLLSPNNIVNRGETAAILWRTLQKIDKYLTGQEAENEATI